MRIVFSETETFRRLGAGFVHFTTRETTREVTAARPRARCRATFARGMTPATAAECLPPAREPLDARDHRAVTRWLSRQNRASVAADRGSREETCTSQPFAPRRPTGIVAAGQSGVDPTSNDTPRESHRAARVALGKRPRLDREGEAEPSGSSAANASRFVSIARACSSSSTGGTSRSASGDVPARDIDEKKDAADEKRAVFSRKKRNHEDVRAALDPRDIDEGVAWLRQCHARLLQIIAASVVARARARVAARGARAAARGAEAARQDEAAAKKKKHTETASGFSDARVQTRAPRSTASDGCARLRPFIDRDVRSFGVDTNGARFTTTLAAYGVENTRSAERETAAALAARARAKRLFAPARRSRAESRAASRGSSRKDKEKDKDKDKETGGSFSTERRGANGCLAGVPLRGSAGARRLREAQSLFRVDRSRVHGFGVFSREAVPKGTPVMEYVGEVVRRPVADRRERAALDASGPNPSTYMFALDERDADSRVVDAARKGNLARFANHSCAPNCETKSVVLQNERRVVLFTTRDVKRGEELTYDYQFAPECPERETPCACGAAACRGVINVRARSDGAE